MVVGHGGVVGIPVAVAVVAGAIAQAAARWLRMVTRRGNLSAVGVGVREVVAVAVATVVVEAGDVGASRAGPGGTTIVTTPLAGGTPAALFLPHLISCEHSLHAASPPVGTRLRSATELAVVTGALLKRQRK